MKITKAQEAERGAAIRALRKMLRPGATAFTILRHVSKSGMRRHVSVMVGGKEPREVSGYVARILGLRRADSGGLIVDGCGMDMGFHVVYALSRALYPNGHRCTKPRPCHSNDHSNRHETAHHSDGGYAIRHRWL